MAKRGRKTAGDILAESAVLDDVRPDAPYHLTEEESEVWKSIVDAMPPGWFRPESHNILAAHCRHVCRERFVSKALRIAEEQHLLRPEALTEYRKLAGECERETKSIISTARALRLTPHARIDPKTAHRRVADAPPPGPPPWEQESYMQSNEETK